MVLKALLERAIPDVFDYLDHPQFRDATNRIVRDVCEASEAPVMVGFSMGSLVGYDVLREASGTLPVRAFVTCGSPIGLPPIHTRLQRDGATQFPAGLKLWLNIWNEDDVATGIRGDQLAKLFPGGTIQNAQTWGRSPSAGNIAGAHNAIDYLSSIAMGLALHVALSDVTGGAT